MSEPLESSASSSLTEPNTSAPDRDEVYYEGSPRLRGELGTLFLWTFFGFLAIVIPLWFYSMEWVSAWWIVVGVLIGIVLWVIPSLLVRRNYYKITNYRIDYEHGILFKKMDTLELWHVEDVSLSQSPIDRIFNVGTITVISGDATNPRLELQSLQNPRKLLELLKSRIIAVKRQRGVVKLDMG